MAKEVKIRKEVQLTESTIDALQKQAYKEGRTLKNYMEFILVQQSEKGKK